jgi:S-formylglutathione hydrolase FrmB
MGFVERLSLLHGMIVRGVLALAVAGLAGGLVRPDRRWWRVTLPRLIGASAVPVAGVAWYLRSSGTVRDHYPPTFGVWAAAALLAVLVAIAGWRSAGGWRRAVAVATVPFTFASLVVLVNSHYDYWPTVGDLLGRPLPDQINRAALTELLAGRPPPPPPAGFARTTAPEDPSAVRGQAPRSGLGTAATSVGASGSPKAGATDGRAVAGAVPGRVAAARVAHAGRRSPRSSQRVAPVAVHGVVGAMDIPPGTSGFGHRKGVLYLPPAFLDTSRTALGVIIMLGGAPGGPEDWTRGGFAARTADAYAAEHHGVAPILAFVDHNGSFTTDTECVDGPAGKAETFLSGDVPRFLSALLHVPVDPRGWAIAGFSEGGTCAFEIAARHPDVYGTFIDLAGDRAPNLGSPAETLQKLYAGNRAAMAAHDPDNLLRPHQFHNLRGWFLAGFSDSRHVAVAERLASAARVAGITVSNNVLAGGHTWRFAAAAFRAVLPSVASQLDGGPTGPISKTVTATPSA